MNFTRLVKEELTQYPCKTDEMLAEMLAYLSFSGMHNKESNTISFKTKIPMVAIRFIKIFKSLYPKLEKELISDKNKLHSQITISIKSGIEQILSEHSFSDTWDENNELLVNSDHTKTAFLRGAFLVKGSINSPETSEYHMEIFATNKDTITYLQSIFNHFNLNAKIIKRRNGYIVYLKEAEKISDFLKLVGAQNNLFRFEDYRIKRDVSNSINRIRNCDFYDLNKASSNGVKQLANIKQLEQLYNFEQIPTSLQEVIIIRKKMPEASLNELVDYYREKFSKSISKSGLYHRFEKIKQLVNGDNDE